MSEKKLPPRVQETLTLLLKGKSEKEVARAMGISSNTVHWYVKMLYQVFDVNSRPELLAKVFQEKLSMRGSFSFFATYWGIEVGMPTLYCNPQFCYPKDIRVYSG
jgi:DNA-binding CsgD family transcriptional regulator